LTEGRRSLSQWRSVRASFVVVGTLTFLGNCLDSSPEARKPAGETGPVVLPLGDILLEETGDYYLGNPWSLVVDTADGSFLISDAFEGQVIRFGRDGMVVQRYGRPGEGPDEFQRMGPTFILNDSVVIGVDSRRRLFKLFSREGGEYLESFRYRGRVGDGVSVVGGMVVAPSVEDTEFTSVLIWDPAGGSFRYLVDPPEPYMQSLKKNGPFAGSLGSGRVVAWADTLLVGMAGVNELRLANWRGDLLDTIRPPSVRRRGVPRDAQVKFDTDMSLSFTDRGEMMSSLHSIYRTLNGETVLVHYDQTIRGEPPTVEFLAGIYVTVLSADRQTACVDGSVPYGNETRARLTMSRDTLFLLDRTLNEAEDGLKTWIRLYRIDTSRCTWTPTG